MIFFRALFFLLVAAITACAPRAAIHVDPAAKGIGTVYSVFVGTTRGAHDALLFGAERDPQLRLARMDISVPPTHETGRIELTRGTPDPQTDFMATAVEFQDGPRAFQAALRRELVKRPRGQRIVMLYIHGYNNNFADGVFRLTQMAADFKLPDVAVHYSWPSLGNPLGYAYDRDSVLFARDGLEEFIRLIDGAGADGILLVAHSIGGLLAVETLRQMEISQPGHAARLLGGVVLISPDIDITLFKQQMTRIVKLPQPFAIFASDRDRALGLSARLTGQGERLGTVTDAAELSEFDIVLFDVSEFSGDPGGHFNTASSPELIQILRLLPGVEAAFRGDRAGRTGLIPGTVLTVRNATQVILWPTNP